MALFLQITCHLDKFHGINDSTLWGYKEQYVLYPIDKSQEKGFGHIENFQILNIKVTDIPDYNLIDVVIGTLKDNIQHEVLLWEPKSLENAFRVVRKVESKNMAMATRRTTPNIYRENNVPSYKPPQPIRLAPQQLEEIKERGLWFNCDNKYIKGHKCGEKKLFYIDCEEGEEQEQEPSQDENVE